MPERDYTKGLEEALDADQAADEARDADQDQRIADLEAENAALRADDAADDARFEQLADLVDDLLDDDDPDPVPRAPIASAQVTIVSDTAARVDLAFEPSDTVPVTGWLIPAAGPTPLPGTDHGRSFDVQRGASESRWSTTVAAVGQGGTSPTTTVTAMIPARPTAPPPDLDVPAPAPRPLPARTNIADGGGTRLVVATQTGGERRDFIVRNAAYPAAPNLEVVGLRCDGEVTLRNGLVSNCGAGIISQGGNDRLTAIDVFVELAGADPAYVGNGLYPWYIQHWFRLIDCGHGPARAGMKMGNGLHAFATNIGHEFAELVRYRALSPAGNIIGAVNQPTKVVRLFDCDFSTSVMQLGRGGADSSVVNGEAIVRGGRFRELALDGRGWVEIDIAGAQIGELVRHGDTIASGNRNWDGCELVKIDGRVVHRE